LDTASAEQSGRATEPMGWRYRTTLMFVGGVLGGSYGIVTFFLHLLSKVVGRRFLLE
jgi:hypothetical protein